jgi:5'-nucleotidase
VFVTHLGLGGDEEMIRGTTGIDVVLGGHNHVVLQPPKLIDDCAGVDEEGRHFITLASPEPAASGSTSQRVRRYCNPRRVVLAHSGAFAKYVGRLDLVASDDAADLPAGHDPLNGFEIVSHQYELFPITEDVPQDARIVDLLEPYRAGLDLLVDLDLLVGYAPDGARRFGSAGGDSPLGNLIATAMWRRLGIETDLSLTNTTGIRTDLVPGPVTVEQMFNVFPFDNSVTKMQLSGVELREMFDFVARRSAGRGCSTQAQIAGARVVLACAECARPDAAAACAQDADCPSNDCHDGQCVPGACAEHVYVGTSPVACASDSDCGGLQNACDLSLPDAQGLGRCGIPIDPLASYELATSTYLANGGSGFVVLKKNTTQLDTRIQQRDALIDWVRGGRPCGAPEGSAELAACSSDADCGGGGRVCACAEAVSERSDGSCATQGACAAGGRCVLMGCRDDVARFWRQSCEDADSAIALASCSGASACQVGAEQCKYLACIDRDLGSFSDGRVMMVGR